MELVSRQKDYDRAQVLSILEPSPHRITPACPYYSSCGGCTMLHVEGEFQRELRRQVLQDLFQREKIVIPAIDIVAAETLGYRCRMQLHDGGLLERGKGKAVIPITSCACATAEINSWLQQIPPEQRAQHHPGRIQIFGDRRVCGGQQVFWASTQKSQNSLQVTGKSRRKVQDKVRRRFSGTVASPATTCTVQLTPGNRSPKMISFDVRGFFQSNLAVLEQAITLLLEYVEEIKTATGKSTWERLSFPLPPVPVPPLKSTAGCSRFPRNSGRSTIPAESRFLETGGSAAASRFSGQAPRSPRTVCR